MIGDPPIAVPVPALRTSAGAIDWPANARYAAAFDATWTPHVIVAGPMGRGEHTDHRDRRRLADLWAATLTEPTRLIVACWDDTESRETAKLGLRPLAMLQADTDAELYAALEALPASAIAYTNPRYTAARLDARTVTEARRRGILPAAVKLSKVATSRLTDVRRAGGTDLTIVHGSGRNITASLDAGADLVVTPPLGALPQPWPAADVTAVQHVVDELQQTLDTMTSHAARVAWIENRATQAA